MKINIGNNLKQLRLQKGLTQEQLADVFGISAQAVSRWENNTSYPDITLLPGLAIYFNTSVDAIVGMDEIRKDETLRKIHGEINDLVISGQTDKAVALIRDSLKIYPNDSGLLMSLGETLAHQLDAGQQEKAESLIRSLPHIWESQEILMPEVYDGEEYTKEFKKCIIKVLSFLCQKIDATTERQLGSTPTYIQLGVDFTPTASTAEMLEQIKTFLEA